MQRLKRRGIVVLAITSLLIWASFGALAAANTVEPSGADDTIADVLPTPPTDPIDCAGFSGSSLVIGTNSADILNGGNGRDCVVGLGGNDTLYGDNGADRILGGSGDDVLFGGTGSDYLDGGPGFDICFGGNGNDTFVNCEVWFEV